MHCFKPSMPCTLNIWFKAVSMCFQSSLIGPNLNPFPCSTIFGALLGCVRSCDTTVADKSGTWAEMLALQVSLVHSYVPASESCRVGNVLVYKHTCNIKNIALHLVFFLPPGLALQEVHVSIFCFFSTPLMCFF